MKTWLMAVASFGLLLGTVSHIVAQDTDACEPYLVSDILVDSGVTAIAFGGIQYSTVGGASITLSAIATNNINLRAEPSTYAAIVGGLKNGEAITVLGRNETGDWLRLERDGERAWVFANLVNVDGDINSLTTGDTLPAAPITTSEFTLGAAEGCEDAVNSGLLLQSPLNEPKQVTVNGLPVGFNGTVLLKVVGSAIRVLNIDFNSAVAVGGADIEILSGGFMDIGADGTATLLAAYSFDDLLGLPLDMLPVTVQRPTSFTTHYGLSPCGFLDDDESLTAAPAGQPIEVRISTTGDTNSQELITQLVNEAQRVLTVNGETVEAWSVQGPYAVDENIGVTWYWVIFEPQPSTYELVLTTINTNTELDDEITCIFEVE